MKRLIKKLCAVILCAAVICGVLGGCGGQAEPTDYTEKLTVMQSGDENGYYYIQQNTDNTANIIYYNYSTLQKTYLSAEFAPGEKNSPESFLGEAPMGCYAFTDGKSLFIYRHGNSVMAQNKGDSYSPIICKSRLDGTDRITFALPQGYIPMQECGFVSDGENIYFVSFIKDAHRTSGGKTAVVRLNTISGECKTLTTFRYKSERYLHIIGVFSGGLVLERTVYDLNDDSLNADVSIQLLYLDTDKRSVAFTYKLHELDGVYINGEYVFARTGENALRGIDLATGAERVIADISLPGADRIDKISFFKNSEAFSDILIADASYKTQGGENAHIDFVYNFANGSIMPLADEIMGSRGSKTVSHIYGEGANGYFVTKSELMNTIIFAYADKTDFLTGSAELCDFEDLT